jgi:hypothetical protein
LHDDFLPDDFLLDDFEPALRRKRHKPVGHYEPDGRYGR